MGPIDVGCHNQLMGHLPACSRSGGSSHAHIGSRCRLSTVRILEQHDGDGPPVWWGKCNTRFFLLPSSLFVSVKRSLTMHWLTYQDSTLAVSVRKQGREGLRKCFFYCIAELAVKPCRSSRSNTRGGMRKSHDTCKTGSKQKHKAKATTNTPTPNDRRQVSVDGETCGEKKGSGSGSQKLVKLTFHAPWWLYAKHHLVTCSHPYYNYGTNCSFPVQWPHCAIRVSPDLTPGRTAVIDYTPWGWTETSHVGVLKEAQTSAAHRSWHGVTRVTFGRQLLTKDVPNPWICMTPGVSFPFGGGTATCWVSDWPPWWTEKWQGCRKASPFAYGVRLQALRIYREVAALGPNPKSSA